MLWQPSSARKTRSGAIFAAWTGPIDFAPLLERAIDTEWPPDAFNQVDEDWPPPDPMNDVDDIPAAPAPGKRKRPSTTYDDCVATGLPLSGPHRRRKIRRLRRIEAEGHVRQASVIEGVVKPAQPVEVPDFDASTLPTAHGAYSGKTEQPTERFGSKKRRSVAELIGLGFQLFKWNGITPHPLADSMGRIFAVLAGQPDNDAYRAATARAYRFIKEQGDATRFPAAMRHHRRGLFAASPLG
ncbi:hypothetical protein B0H13DRAFT_2351363 [Mycena leptocephala]|nr:hypothetical protein B0H13DRAFT_2351363 [Mycena leptocephala]